MRSLLLAAFALNAFGQGVIVTVAGTDLVFQGNGKPAIAAPLGRVARVAVDSNGRPVFADPNYNLVFRVETDGSLRVLAGNNVQGLASGGLSGGSGGGFSGDTGPATSAALNRPMGAAYDSSGNLYIADTSNQRIRRVDPSGVITTVAGNGRAAFSGDGPALNTSLNFPTDVVADNNGNLYIYDNLNVRIRKLSQGNLTTIAGTGTAGVSSDNVPAAGAPIGDVASLAVDAQGNLYFTEIFNHRVRRISNGTLTTVAGTGNAGFGADGPALAVALNQPAGVAVDSKNNILIADGGNHRILKLTGSVLATVAGTHQPGFSGDGGPARNATLHTPSGLAVSPTLDVFVADVNNFRIRRLDSQNVISTVAGSGTLISAQNGIAAPLATFFDPFGVTVDQQGALLIADTNNNILRKSAANGTLSTIAGTGAWESSGDGGSLAQAGLKGPFSVFAGLTGNLLVAESDSGLVRSITNSGSISSLPVTFNNPTQAISDTAGNIYIADFTNNRVVRRAADGTFTQFPTAFAQPAGLALDNAGSLYVTEFGAGRVWRVSLATVTATVVAGGGKLAGTTADGGLATNAQLSRPAGITLDSAGNLYFSEFGAGAIRRVGLDGKISTVAGNGAGGFFGDGGPAVNASLRGPWGLSFDTAGSLYVADVVNNRIRKILVNTAPTFSVDTATLSFVAPSNGVVTDPAALNLTASLSGAAFPLLFGVTSDVSWLQTTPGGGAMPQQLQVTADPTGLAPGTYTGKLTITAAGASPAVRTVAVTFKVNAALPSSLGVDGGGLNFSFVTGASPVNRPLAIRNFGSGTLNWSIVSCPTAAAWLTVSPASGIATPNVSGTANLTVTPGTLDPGTYVCVLQANSSAGNPVSIPVSVLVAAPSTQLVLSQAGLSFQAIAGGGLPLARTFGILNGGQGVMSWTAKANTFSGGPWLSVSPASGSVATPLTDVSQVTVSVNSSGMAAGVYYGKVDINAPNNPLQTVTVVLNVLASNTQAKPDVYPSGIVFTGVPGVNPGSQTFSLANLGSQPLTFTSSRQAAGESPWFVHVPTSGTIAPNQPANIVVQPDFSSLPPGNHQGSIALQFSDGSTLTVSLLATVVAPTATAHGAHATGSCTPSTLNFTLAGSQQALTVTMGQATDIEVVMTDNCQTYVTGANTSATVSVGFSNQDQGVNLQPIPSPQGDWRGSWTPHNSAASGTVTLHLVAQVTTPRYILTIKDITAKVVSPPPAVQQPIIKPGQVENLASYRQGVPVAPGSLITIFGSGLASGTDVHLTPPLPTSLADTQVFLGGRALPLIYASDGQLNAQVPVDLPPNTQQQIQVIRGSVPSVPDLVAVAPAAPAVFTYLQSGSGQGAIIDAVVGGLKDTTAPAKTGDFVAIYCTGLGAVSPAVPEGQPADSTILSKTVNPVTVTIGGVSAPVFFAGLAPGYAGLYVVNVQMVPGIPAGDSVPVVLTVAGQQSPPVTMAVK